MLDEEKVTELNALYDEHLGSQALPVPLRELLKEMGFERQLRVIAASKHPDYLFGCFWPGLTENPSNDDIEMALSFLMEHSDATRHMSFECAGVFKSYCSLAFRDQRQILLNLLFKDPYGASERFSKHADILLNLAAVIKDQDCAVIASSQLGDWDRCCGNVQWFQAYYNMLLRAQH